MKILGEASEVKGSGCVSGWGTAVKVGRLSSAAAQEGIHLGFEVS